MKIVLLHSAEIEVFPYVDFAGPHVVLRQNDGESQDIELYGDEVEALCTALRAERERSLSLVQELEKK